MISCCCCSVQFPFGVFEANALIFCFCLPGCFSFFLIKNVLIKLWSNPSKSEFSCTVCMRLSSCHLITLLCVTSWTPLREGSWSKKNNQKNILLSIILYLMYSDTFHPIVRFILYFWHCFLQYLNVWKCVKIQYRYYVALHDLSTREHQWVHFL